MYPLPQPSRPQPMPWSSADTYPQAPGVGPLQYHHARQGMAEQPWGHPHSPSCGATPAQYQLAYQHAFPGQQQQMAAYSSGINHSAGSGGYAVQSWWPRQQQQQQSRAHLQPAQQQMAQYASPTPWITAGGQPQGMAAPLSNPALCPPSFLAPQPHVSWPYAAAGQAAAHGPVDIPAQAVFSTPQPAWMQRNPVMPTGQHQAQPASGIGPYGPPPARPVQPSTLVPGAGSIAVGVPVEPRPGAATAAAHPQAASGPQLTGLDLRAQRAAPAFSAPGVPQQHSQQQTFRRPSPSPAAAAAAPMARLAVPQPPPPQAKRPHVAAEPTAQPAVDAGHGEAPSGGPPQDEAARLRRPANADAGK